MMWQLKPGDIRYRGKSFWFEEDGTLYYGPNLDNLVFPEGLELTGVLPLLSLADLKAAFLLGRKVGREVRST